MGWIAGWNKRIKLTISGSCIEGDLDNFPIMVHLGTTCSGVFNELGSNSKRISIVTPDQQQCYVEIECWDESTNNAWMWVNIPTLTSGMDSDLYLYYDNLRPDNSAYVGTVGETSAQNVWDSNFVGIWHMNQDPSGGAGCILNSTSFSGLDGTPAGSMTSSGLVNGKIGEALSFDGSDDYIYKTDNAALSITGALTLESTFKTDLASDTTNRGIVAKYTGTDDDRSYALVLEYVTDNNNPKLHVVVSPDGTAGAAKGKSGGTNLGAVSTYYGAGVFTPSTKLEVFLNGISDGSLEVDIPAAIDDNVSGLWIGSFWRITSTEVFNGIIDEVRISNTVRSASWIKATYYSNWDQLLFYGNEEVVSSGFLAGWNNRLKLTIQNDYVDNTLTDFPVMIHLSDSSGFNSYDNRGVFYELEADVNRKKIAITDSTGTLQCFVEIERFSCAETQAVLWTKLPVIYADVGTHFYLYYDKTRADNISFVGDVNSIQAQNVWDFNFVGVWHMNQDPSGGSGCIKDSTSNTNHGTPAGSMVSGDLVDGKIGKALDFNGSQTISIPSTTALNMSGNMCLEVVAKPTNAQANSKHMFLTKSSSYIACYDHDTAIYTGVINVKASTWKDGGGPVAISNGVYSHFAGVYDGTYLKTYINTTEDSNNNIGFVTVDTNTNQVCIASDNATSNFFTGIIEEVRISNTARSAPWIKATYHSNWDDLIIYEIEDISASWLSDWSKRIKLTTDQTKIDSSLTDFPVLITLVSGSHSDFFSDLEYGSVDDGFTGSNGSSLNSDLWYRNTTLSDSKVEIQSNKAKLTYVLSESNATLLETSYYILSGDFDIQVDIDLLTDLTTHAWWSGLQFNAQDGTGYWGYIARGYDTGSSKHFRFRYNGAGGNSSNYEGSSLTSSKLRLVRSGLNISAYYWDGSWNQNGSSNAWGSADIKISLYGYKIFTTSELQMDFDNFTVTSGTVIWPQDTYPNRKKIAVTINDGTTQCPVEIEQFDTTSGTVNLWTKTPLISYSSDTDFYLYYDKTKDDNTGYVGDVGSTPAQSVWDENFVGVWHMNQDPSGGVGCIKDSTSSSNDGTVSGTMTSDDLVDGKIGKALDFDGTDDIIASDIGTLGITSGFTLEGIINVSASLSHSAYIILKQRSGNTTNGIILWLMLSGSDLYLRCDIHTTGNNRIATQQADIDRGVGIYVAGVYKGDQLSPLLYRNSIPIDDYTSDGSGSDLTDDTGLSCISGRSYDNARHVDGTIDETRISNIARSFSWIKATYYSNWNTLLTYGSVQTYTLPPDYYYHGYVKEKGDYVSRKLYLYKRDTGLLVDSCVSNDSTGYYLLETSVSGEHFIVALDDDAGDTYNALIQDRLYPNDI